MRRSSGPAGTGSRLLNGEPPEIVALCGCVRVVGASSGPSLRADQRCEGSRYRHPWRPMHAHRGSRPYSHILKHESRVDLYRAGQGSRIRRREGRRLLVPGLRNNRLGTRAPAGGAHCGVRSRIRTRGDPVSQPQAGLTSVPFLAGTAAPKSAVPAPRSARSIVVDC